MAVPPVMEGATVLDGTGCGAGVTAEVGADTAVAEPEELVAVTEQVMTLPFCAEVNVLVEFTAPDMATPSAYHWYVYVAAEPDHVPSHTVRVWPSAAVPDITGAEVFNGAITGGVITAEDAIRWRNMKCIKTPLRRKSCLRRNTRQR